MYVCMHMKAHNIIFVDSMMSHLGPLMRPCSILGSWEIPLTFVVFAQSKYLK